MTLSSIATLARVPASARARRAVPGACKAILAAGCLLSVAACADYGGSIDVSRDGDCLWLNPHGSGPRVSVSAAHASVDNTRTGYFAYVPSAVVIYPPASNDLRPTRISLAFSRPDDACTEIGAVAVCQVRLPEWERSGLSASVGLPVGELQQGRLPPSWLNEWLRANTECRRK